MKSIKILLVDDDLPLLDMYQFKLTQAGYKVLTADNGQSAWEVIELHHPEAIVLDLWMPKMNGLELLKKLRGHEEYTHLPVIVMTNSASVEDRERATDLHVQGFLTKADCTPSDVAKAINQILH